MLWIFEGWVGLWNWFIIIFFMDFNVCFSEYKLDWSNEGGDFWKKLILLYLSFFFCWFYLFGFGGCVFLIIVVYWLYFSWWFDVVLCFLYSVGLFWLL